MVMDAIIFRGANLNGGRVGPTILERTDQEFIPAILDGLGQPNGLQALMRTVARATDRQGVLKLYQPVHRTFHVALLEVACDTFGEPRLDPKKIESAGLVIRRVSTDERGRQVMQGWRRAGQTLQGWMSFRTQAEMNQDPDPLARPPELQAGSDEINRRLALINVSPTYAETTSPLFVAPPEACETAKRTILYGLVPLTSTEQSETPTAFPAFSRDALRSHVPRFMRRGGPRPINASKTSVTYDDVKAESINHVDAALSEFVDALRQLAIEFNAFGETAAARNLLRELNNLRFSFTSSWAQPVGDYLKAASKVLLEGEGNDRNPQPAILLPVEWPVVSANQAERFVDVVQAAMRAQLDTIAPRGGRYDDAKARYVIRAFVRVKRDDGCPPALVWSDYSRAFTIAPWYEASNAVAPVRVSLPNPLDTGFLKGLKPNVAFSVPEELFNLMQGLNLKDILDGKKPSAGGGIALDWICGFNIPIITLCAFIVLNIFLSLFDLFLQWMLMVKICIPIPKRQ